MHVNMYAELMKKQKENSLENITWSEMGKQNVQAKEVYSCDSCEADFELSPSTGSQSLQGEFALH